MALKIEGFHFLIGDLDSSAIDRVRHKRFDRQPSRGGRGRNIAERNVEGAQRAASPIETDLRKQPMLNRIVFGAASWRVTHDLFSTVCGLPGGGISGLTQYFSPRHRVDSSRATDSASNPDAVCVYTAVYSGSEFDGAGVGSLQV